MLVTGAAFAALAPNAKAFGISEWEAGTCTIATCRYSSPDADFYTQAAGHPQFGITGFRLKGTGTKPLEINEGALKNVRVDVPPGLAADPFAPAERCPVEKFEHSECAAVAPGSVVGFDEVEAVVGAADVPLLGTVYDLEQEEGVPLEFGIQVATEHSLLIGHLSWYHEPQIEAQGVATGDYHEYFEIKNIGNTTPLLESRLVFESQPKNIFLTLPSECSTTHNPISHLWVESWEGATATAFTEDPVGVSGCTNVPFEPSVAVTPSTAQSDEPDGATIEVKVPQNENSATVESSNVKNADVTLPPGMTLDPSSANGLAACSNAQFGRDTASPIGCPPASQIGTAAIETPDLPAGSLTGNVYLAAPEPGASPSSGGEYRIFLAAESPRYGVGVRLEGRVGVNEQTGQLTTAVLENPQLPFSDFIVHLNPGPRSPLANPLLCGAATTTSAFTPFSAPASVASPTSVFGVTGCPSSPPPFSLSQATHVEPATGGASGSSFTYNLARGNGEQYLWQVQTTLPEGLLGSIADVPHLCGEAEANAGTCPAESQIGTVQASAGSGSEPFTLPPGPVYLTGPYGGAPFGLSVVVPAEHIGPYDYGKVVTRATVAIDPRTTRVTSVAALPMTVGGVPARLRSLSVTLNKPNFLVNPTSCSPALTTDSKLIGTATLPPTPSATQLISTPFPLTGCSGLPFAPTFSSGSNSKTASRANGASLDVTLTLGSHDANLKEVDTTLPPQLVSRLTTLQKACTAAQFAASPAGCPAAARVANATLTTPLLPGVLHGHGYLVSHGGAAFPDLDFVLEGDGVTLIQESHTSIKNSITSSSFPLLPDAPFNTFKASFPVGADSLLDTNGSLCTKTVTARKRVLVRKHGRPVRRHGHRVYRTRKVRRKVATTLLMPTTLVAQNGARHTQNTKIAVAGCGKSAVRGKRILHPRVRVHGHTAFITIAAPSRGFLSARGHGVRAVRKRIRRAGNATIRVKLSRAGVSSLQAHHKLRVRIRLSFVPTKKGEGALVAIAKATF